MMMKKNALTPIFGSSQGSGMAVLIVITGVLTVLVGIAGYLNKRVWNVESEVLDLDFAYVERQRVDNRPFFAEGGEFFAGYPYFYTQRVGAHSGQT